MHAPNDVPELPCVEAVVAGTVALMTAWAAPCPNAALDAGAQRALLAHKVVSNLLVLRQHPALSPALRQVMANAHRRWVDVASGQGAAPAQPGIGAPARRAVALH